MLSSLSTNVKYVLLTIVLLLLFIYFCYIICYFLFVILRCDTFKQCDVFYMKTDECFFFKYDTFKQYDVFDMKTDEMVSFLFYFILLSLTESLVYPTADHAPIFSNREYRSMHDHTLQWRPSAVRGLPTILERQNCGTVIYCVIVYALRRYQFTI